MEDDEAEAVLLALGARLVWESPEEGFTMARIGSEIYSIELSDHFYKCSYEPHALKAETYAPHVYQHLREAMAACERHHATREWK